MVKITSFFILGVCISTVLYLITKPQKSTHMDDCIANIELILNKDLQNWKGLDVQCNRTRIEAHFSFNEGEGVFQRIHPQNSYQTRFKTLNTPNFEDPLFFHYQGDTLFFVTTDFWSLEESDCKKLLDFFGKPEAKLDFMAEEFIEGEKEWVYPKLGISLALNAEEQMIIKLMFFAPCTLEYYKDFYYQQQEYREFKEK